MTRPTKPTQLCVVRVGFRLELLLPADDGMKLVKLLQSAVACDTGFGSLHRTYTPSADPLDVEFVLVQPNQLRARVEPRKSTPAGPLLLEG